MYTYGMYAYGMYAYGMYTYGMYTYGMYTYGEFLGWIFLGIFFGIFLGNFLTYDLLTIASFRIGVPSILFFMETSEVQDPLKGSHINCRCFTIIKLRRYSYLLWNKNDTIANQYPLKIKRIWFDNEKLSKWITYVLMCHLYFVRLLQ